MKVYVMCKLQDAKGRHLSSVDTQPYVMALGGRVVGHVFEERELTEKQLETLRASNLFVIRLDDPRPNRGRLVTLEQKPKGKLVTLERREGDDDPNPRRSA